MLRGEEEVEEEVEFLGGVVRREEEGFADEAWEGNFCGGEGGTRFGGLKGDVVAREGEG